MLFPVSSSPRSAAPTMKPARSYSPSAYSPGISAVSPPISAHPFFLHPRAIPRQLVHGPETADLGQHPGGKRLPRELLNGGDGAIGLVDVHARIAVANWFFGGQIPVYGVRMQARVVPPVA